MVHICLQPYQKYAKTISFIKEWGPWTEWVRGVISSKNTRKIIGKKKSVYNFKQIQEEMRVHHQGWLQIRKMHLPLAPSQTCSLPQELSTWLSRHSLFSINLHWRPQPNTILLLNLTANNRNKLLGPEWLQAFSIPLKIGAKWIIKKQYSKITVLPTVIYKTSKIQ